MTKTSISLEVTSTSPDSDIIVQVMLDDQEILSATAADLPAKLAHEFDDDEGEHILKIQMSGKDIHHTQVDDDGSILKDVLINVKNFEFDGVNIDQLVWELSQYHHDFNGSKDSIVDEFFGTMGCNGLVELKFSSPVYIWLLENM